jgi:hypothetical protein
MIGTVYFFFVDADTAAQNHFFGFAFTREYRRFFSQQIEQVDVVLKVGRR